MFCDFLSERSCALHKEYLEKLKLRYSILEKSVPEIRKKEISEIQKMRVPYKNEILSLRCDIICHELFFTSFCHGHQNSKCVKEAFGSEAAFFYEIYQLSKEKENCFAIISMNRGFPRLSFGLPSMILRLSSPVLALDLYEHAYFLDYGFDKEEYVRRMLSCLNLNKVV